MLKKSYEDGMKYYGDLKKEGKLTDMTMAEFADYYRQKRPTPSLSVLCGEIFCTVPTSSCSGTVIPSCVPA